MLFSLFSAHKDNASRDSLRDALLGFGLLLPVCSCWPPSLPGYRLLNGEGDLLPGLVCGVYGSSTDGTGLT
jgi:hypothetical protein